MAIHKTYMKGTDDPVLPDETKGIEVFYKYRTINDRNLDILRNKKIFFSKPESFNDPFDVDVPVRFDLMTNQEFDDMSIAIIQQEGMVDKQTATEHYLKNTKSKPGFGTLEYRNQMRDSQMIHLKESSTVFCLSSKNDDILLWSHYSNNHTGMCIGFNHNFVFHNTGVAFGKVKYHDAYPLFNPTDKLEDHYIGQLLSKANDWKYESEFRFIDLRTRSSFDIEPLAIEEVIVGCCVSDADLTLVKDTVRSDATLSHVKLFRAEKVPYQYKLEIKPL